jgi:hypothetical protein
MEATDWLDEAVQQTKEKYQVQRALEDKLIQEEALKARLASKFCEELFAWLETIDVKFNTRFGGQVLAVSPTGGKGDSGLQVLARPIRAQERVTVLSHQKETNAISVSTDHSLTKLPQVIKLVLAADSAMLAEIGTDYYMPEELGRKIINDLLGIGSVRPVSQSQFTEPPCRSASSNNIEMLGRAAVAGGGNGRYAGAVS